MAESSREAASASHHLGRDSDDEDEDEDVAGGQLWHHRRLQQQVGYLSLEGSFSGGLSPQPSSSAECVRRVSPLDPNLSSAARYSPPPPYNESMDDNEAMEESLDHPDSAMEELGHNSSLPRFPVGVSSSMQSGTVSIVVSEAHHVPALPPTNNNSLFSTNGNSSNRNSLFAGPRMLPKSQPRWDSPQAGIDDEDEDDVDEPEEVSAPLSPVESVWAKQRKLKMQGAHSTGLKSSFNPQPGPSNSQVFAGPSNTKPQLSNTSKECEPVAGPSGVSTRRLSGSVVVHCGGVGTSDDSVFASRRSIQPNDMARPGPSREPQPSPSIHRDAAHASPSGDGLVSQTNRGRNTIRDSDSDSDSQDNLPHFSNSPGPSGIVNHLVRLNDGEAEALVGNVSGCEASSSIRGHATPLGSPRTPADNCIVSSSTGHIDSIPPTPAEFQGNDVSGPSSPVSPNLSSVAILDSTVDSTSGRGMIEAPNDSSDDSNDNLAHANHMNLVVIPDEAAEISTSEIGLQHSDDSQDVGILVSPQGMFASGRSSANRFIEQLSLSLSQFSNNSLDGSLSGDVSDQRTPQASPPPHPHPQPYLDDPLAIPGPSRLSLPVNDAPVSSHVSAASSEGQASSLPSTSRTQVLPHPVEVLDSSLPLLHLSPELPVCSAAQDSVMQNSIRPETVRPLVSITSSTSSNISNDVLAGNSSSQALGQLNQSYVLINEDSSLNSDSALSSSSLVVKVDQEVNQPDFSNLSRGHHGLVDHGISEGSGHHALVDHGISGDSGHHALVDHGISGSSGHHALVDHDISGDSGHHALVDHNISGDSDHHALVDHDISGGSLGLGLSSSQLSGVMEAAMPGPSSQPSLNAQSDQVSLLVDGEEDSSDGALLMMLSSNSSALNDPLVLDKQLQRDTNRITSHLRPTPDVTQQQSSSKESDENHQNNIDPPNEAVCVWEGSAVWSGEGEESYDEQHVQAIVDKPVRTRAWASLPAQHLVIRRIQHSQEYGVFVRKSIPKRTQFGPMEGVLREDEEAENELELSIYDEGRILHLDTSDEASSNWMRFVRKASTYLEQNCVVTQTNAALVFLTTTDIAPRTELRVGYSKQYADKRGLATLQPTPEEIKILEAVRRSWPCYECDEAFETSPELQQHLVCHDQEVGDEDKKKRKRIKTKRVRASGDPVVAGKKVAKKPKVCEGSNEAAGPSGTAETQSKSGEGSVEAQQHRCQTCNLVFKMAELLKIHQLIHSEVLEGEGEAQLKNVYKGCPQCFKVYETLEDLLSHVGEHGFFLPIQARPFKCDFCYKSFLRRERLEQHMAVHGNETEKPFRCGLCLRRFCTSTGLNTHIKFHIEGSKGYDCPICREGFFSVVGLKAHVATHCVNGEYACPTCKKVFPTYLKVRRHIRSYHAVMPHTCSICGKDMPSVDKLKIHMLSHSDRRDFLCPDCGKRFKRKDKLREHTKRMHSSERQAKAKSGKAPSKVVPKVDPADYKKFLYKCHDCLLGFKRRGMLVNHLAKRHPNIDLSTVPELNQPILKPKKCYSCHHCDKMYRSSSKRKLHILKYHPGAELPPSTTNDSETSEAPSYSKTYPHHCTWCYRQYASRARLLRHQRHQHPEKFGQQKDYDVDKDGNNGLSGELTLAGPLVTDAGILGNHRFVSLARASEDGSMELKEEDLLTQAMGEITPLAGGEQYVRILGAGTEGQQVVVGTAAGTRPLLVSSDGGQQATTLALVTTDGPAETVTLSLPAGQIFSIIPGLSVAGPSSNSSRVVTGSSGMSGSEQDTPAGPSTMKDEGVAGAMVGGGFDGECVEQVVLAPHQPASPSPPVWPQNLSFTSNSTS